MAAANPEVTREAMLVARLQSGDADAFEMLVRTYMPVLLRVARRFMRSKPRTGFQRGSEAADTAILAGEAREGETSWKAR